MDLESLEKRLKEINTQINQIIANYNMLEGCKQEIMFWINKLSNTNIEDKKE